ncbi:amidohydrolase 2 [Macrolepiota fuliginosa MF-IS2]|uniref:Amidohydrolase 2 n=1 Tax=Macrolepiota fuliginosa MF-IS2 TaxID=1400762 RepID=A0A9P5XBS9_9AGAR|nr:amidohydrolase 2 [Macrolepiota fuliginosa MF-IS2]
MAGFIDLHHHFFPQDLDKANASAQVGWRTPEENLPWTPELSIKAMGSAGIQAAVLSFPASASGQVSAENRVLARSRNDYVAAVCRKYPDRFGFFATLPFLDDVRGVLDEITYAFDVIGADGISVSSSYGEGATAAYVGHDKYDSIWAELDRRKAVVFLHGNALPSSVPWPHPTLGLPISEVPNETFKAAAHLVVTGRKRRYPNIKIILAHLGGSTPFLASRVAVLSHYMGCELTPEQILDDFKSFYYDTALSAWGPNLIAMDNFVSHTQILFGTDFPAVSTEMSNWYTHQLEHHYGADCSGNEKLQAIGWRNALDMFPQLRERIFAANNGTEGARRLQCMLRL